MQQFLYNLQSNICTQYLSNGTIKVFVESSLVLKIKNIWLIFFIINAIEIDKIISSFFPRLIQSVTKMVTECLRVTKAGIFIVWNKKWYLIKYKNTGLCPFFYPPLLKITNLRNTLTTWNHGYKIKRAFS